MNRMPLDIYEIDMMPRAQKVYLMRYGWHFNRAAYMLASDLMRKQNKNTGKLEKVPRYTKDEVDALLQRHNVQVEHKGGYDYVYAAQMCRADYLGSSIADEQHLALYVKDTCDCTPASGTISAIVAVSMFKKSERYCCREYASRCRCLTTFVIS